MIKKDSVYKDSDFKDKAHNEVPALLSNKILKDMSEYVQPSIVLTSIKYSLVFLFSAGLSLFLCPQKGFGFLDENYPLFFHFLHHNLLICGIYCGLFFGLLTHGSALFFLNHYERNQVKHRVSWVSFALFAISFSIFMVIGEDYYSADYVYSISWTVTVILMVLGVNRIKLYSFQ
jgi:hypothetical protein